MFVQQMRAGGRTPRRTKYSDLAKAAELAVGSGKGPYEDCCHLVHLER
jgi:hypothetical protein